MNLENIFRKNKTDKLTHGYAPVYESYLKNLRTQDFVLFEIGHDKGYSAASWREYFSKADIHTFDIRKIPSTEGVSLHYLDQESKEGQTQILNSINLEPLVVIDDGGHKPEHHQKSLSVFFKKLKPGGLYFIEDLQVCQGFKSEKYQVTPENNTLLYLQGIINGSYKDSIFLTEEENQYLKEHIKSVKLYVKDKLAVIRKHDFSYNIS